ncbi:fibronectin type III domain-containing protein 5-like [Lethenteron reissneri]|uniref:fibronectin type III domain-containing protein 5-like n=1 Tax=Lethenteron reissneri TaxID=7753 RepID=UPI002AB73445|nr:fibronectin type III domain-containing protein 5-like [Lethenteron reissneri]
MKGQGWLAVTVLDLALGLIAANADRPPPPVNVSVSAVRASSVIVSWDVADGDSVIGYAISQQKRPGARQRFITEVNTTARSCLLWGLEGASDYVVAVQALGRGGAASEPSPGLRFSTPPEGDSDEQRDSNNSSSSRSSSSSPSSSSSLSVATSLSAHGGGASDVQMNALDNRELMTGEMIIIVLVLVMWAAVIAHFCRQYDIIKDNDSKESKEKVKISSSESSPDRSEDSIKRGKYTKTPTINIIEV